MDCYSYIFVELLDDYQFPVLDWSDKPWSVAASCVYSVEVLKRQMYLQDQLNGLWNGFGRVAPVKSKYLLALETGRKCRNV